jgi:hypothetical protein
MACIALGLGLFLSKIVAEGAFETKNGKMIRQESDPISYRVITTTICIQIVFVLWLGFGPKPRSKTNSRLEK